MLQIDGNSLETNSTMSTKRKYNQSSRCAGGRSTTIAPPLPPPSKSPATSRHLPLPTSSAALSLASTIQDGGRSSSHHRSTLSTHSHQQQAISSTANALRAVEPLPATVPPLVTNASKKIKDIAAANATTKELSADSVSRKLEETALGDLTNSPAKGGGVRNKNVVTTKNGQKMGVKKGVTNSTKGPKKGGMKQGGTKGGAPSEDSSSIDSPVVLPLSNMATLNEQHRIKLQKKVPKGSIGNYNPTQQYAPAIVAKINEINEIDDSVPSSTSKRKLQRALTNLSEMLWIHGYDLIINNIKNAATIDEEGKRVLLEMLTEMKHWYWNEALDRVEALAKFFQEDEEIRTKFTEYNAAKKSSTTKSNKKRSIQALAAFRLNAAAKSAFPGTSDEELRLKSIFDSNAKAFAERTEASKRKASNNKANKANKRRKTAEDELEATKKKGDAETIVEATLALNEAKEKADIASYAQSRKAKQLLEAEKQRKIAEQALVAAKKKGDAEIIAAATLALNEAKEKADIAYAQSRNGQAAARNKASNDKAKEAEKQRKIAEQALVAAKKKGDAEIIAAATLALNEAKEKADIAYAQSRNGQRAARNKASNDKAKEAEKQRKIAEQALVAAKKKGDAEIIAAATLALNEAKEKADIAYAQSRNGQAAARRTQISDVFTIDRRKIFTGLDEAIAKQKEYTNPTQRVFEIQRILREGVENCNSDQTILDKLKSSRNRKHKDSQGADNHYTM
eukprot:scaffold11714_cov102-Skeletonema_dohrnii-CCMP3373.AAC.2